MRDSINSTSYLSPKLELRPWLYEGQYGVFARMRISAGEVLIVWGGRILCTSALGTLNERTRRCAIQIEEHLHLVPHPLEPADYVNHSCDPNAGLQGQIVLVALRDIVPDEEVCYDYAMSDSDPFEPFQCQCGTSICRRWVTHHDWQLPQLQQRYAGYFSPYLQRRIQLPRTRAVGDIRSIGLSGT